MNKQMNISFKYFALGFKLIFSLFIYTPTSYSITFNLR